MCLLAGGGADLVVTSLDDVDLGALAEGRLEGGEHTMIRATHHRMRASSGRMAAPEEQQTAPKGRSKSSGGK